MSGRPPPSRRSPLAPPGGIAAMPAPVQRDAGLSALIEGEVRTVASGDGLHRGALAPGRDPLFPGHEGAPDLPRGPLRRGLRAPRADRGAERADLRQPGRHRLLRARRRRMSRMNRDGTGVTTVVESFQGRRLNSPNDVICDRAGRVFFTDPPYGVTRPEDKELPFQGVFRLSPDLTSLDLVLSEGSRNPTAWPSRPTNGTSTSATPPGITSSLRRGRLRRDRPGLLAGLRRHGPGPGRRARRPEGGPIRAGVRGRRDGDLG